VGSRYGQVLVAVRDAESRTRFLGYRPEYYKLVVWTLSAMIAGIGGALYVPQIGIINPSEFAPANSIEAVIWVAVGGRGTLTGAILGAVLVNFGKTVLTGALPGAWLYALGGLFILVTLFLPRGIIGTFARRRVSPRLPTAAEPQGLAAIDRATADFAEAGAEARAEAGADLGLDAESAA
jgi:urea transport system permease protein